MLPASPAFSWQEPFVHICYACAADPLARTESLLPRFPVCPCWVATAAPYLGTDPFWVMAGSPLQTLLACGSVTGDDFLRLRLGPHC